MWKYSRCGLLLGCQSKSLINVNGGRTNACNFFSLGFDSSFLQSDLWRFLFGSEGQRKSNRDIELKLWFIIKSNGLVMSLLWSYQLMHWPVRTPQGLSTALKYTTCRSLDLFFIAGIPLFVSLFCIYIWWSAKNSFHVHKKEQELSLPVLSILVQQFDSSDAHC